MAVEQWRDVIGYEGIYQVSNLGQVRSLDRPGRGRWAKGRVMRPSSERHGHLHVILCKEGARRTAKIHHLVLEAFRGPCPCGYEGAHRDSDPTNNCLGNLRWATHGDNESDKITHGTTNRGSRHGNLKFSEETVVSIRIRRARGERVRDLAREFGVHRHTIHNIVNQRTWTHIDGE